MLERIKHILSHRVFITVALSETGRVKGANVHSALLVSFVTFMAGLFVYLGFYGGGQELMEDLKQLAEYKSELEDLRGTDSYRREQFKIIAQEMGIMQARLDRFDAIGERLFQDDEIGDKLRDVEGIEGSGGLGEDIIDVPSLDELKASFSALNERMEKAESTMQAGLELLITRQKDNLMQPHLWPVVNPRTRLTSKFGWRKDPFSGRKKWHSGIDIGAGWNEPIVATSDGIVVFSGYRHHYGVMVEMRHAGGFESRYGHMAKALVKNGQRVKAGEVVGLMGSSGRSTGPHLHFEVLIDGHKVNPYPFVKDNIAAARRKSKDPDFKAAFALVKKQG